MNKVQESSQAVSAPVGQTTTLAPVSQTALAPITQTTTLAPPNTQTRIKREKPKFVIVEMKPVEGEYDKTIILEPYEKEKIYISQPREMKELEEIKIQPDIPYFEIFNAKYGWK